MCARLACCGAPAIYLTLLVTFTQCGGERSERPREPQSGQPASQRVTEPAVATVNGVAIPVSVLRKRLRQGQMPAETLRELIALELLAQEASRRGYDQSPDVLAIRRKALAAVLVAEGFGKSFRRKDIPLPTVRQAYEHFRGYYRHPELKVVRHILARTPKEATAQQKKAARRLAEQIAGALGQLRSKNRLNAASFHSLAAAEVAKHPGKLITEQLTTPRHGQTVEPFAKAAFALADGELSTIVETRFGFHVLFCEVTRPARNDSLEKVEDDVRKRLFPAERERAFQRFAEGLEKGHAVRLYPKRLFATTAQGPAKAAGGTR